MLEPTTDYSPDLEWMLQSGQAPESLIIDTLVQDYYDRIYCFCLSALEDPGRAHQATHNTFTYTVRNAHRYRSQEGVQAWLYRAARRCSRGLAWKVGRKSSDEQPGAATGPESEAEAGLWRALESLNPDERQMLLLSAVQELPLEEIAGVFQTETGAIEARLEAIWKKLERQVEIGPLSDELLRQALERRWPACAPLDEQRLGASETIRAQAGRKFRLPPWQVGGVVLIGLLLVAFLLSEFSNSFFAEKAPATSTPRVELMQEEGEGDEDRAASGASLKKLEVLSGAAAGASKLAGKAEVVYTGRLELPRPAKDALSVRSGPASLGAVLNFWGWKGTAKALEGVLQPNPDDEVVMPHELLAYVKNHTDYRAVLRFGGDEELLQRLVKAGFPVIIQRGYENANGVWAGKYQVVDGFSGVQMGYRAEDQAAEPKIGLYPDQFERYNRLTAGWRAFNYLYLVVYPEREEAKLMEALGSQADPAENYRQAARKAEEEIYSLSGVNRFFAWFNRATSLAYLEDSNGAAQAYDQAFALYWNLPLKERPFRLLWYQSRPLWAYYYDGRYEEVIRLADEAVQAGRNAVLEEVYYWRALAREALGDREGAIADLEETLFLNPNFSAGSYHLNRIKNGDS